MTKSRKPSETSPYSQCRTIRRTSAANRRRKPRVHKSVEKWRSAGLYSRRDFCKQAALFALGTVGNDAFPLGGSLSGKSPEIFDVISIDRVRVLAAAQRYLRESPITITDCASERSPGGKHDYFSEADYFWPDPNNPTGPYIPRDGVSNPNNFLNHRHF